MSAPIAFQGRTLRAAFMGTPSFALPSLAALHDVAEVPLVVTRPDAVRSRGKRAEPSPVKAGAQGRGIAVCEARRVTPEVLGALRAARPDVIVVAAYGALLPDEVLGLAALGCVNVHASLLPRWRGAAPIQAAILAGDERAGVSIMRLTHEMDAGPYCRQASLATGDLTCAQLTEALAELGAAELVDALRTIAAGEDSWTEQDESRVTFAPKVGKAHMRITPGESSHANALRVRASNDAAPARLTLAGKGLRVLAAREVPQAVAQGTFERRKARVLLGCAEGTLEPLRVKPDGKREMDAAAWAAGLREAQGEWE